MTKAFSADTHRSMHSFSCVYEKHFLNTFYMRPKRRTLTQKERVPARIWRNPACSFHTWIHISLVWFGLEYRVFPHHFKSTSKLKLREMCDNVNGTQQQWQSRKNITNELERIVKNAHIVSFICYKFVAFLLLLQQRNSCQMILLLLFYVIFCSFVQIGISNCALMVKFYCTLHVGIVSVYLPSVLTAMKIENTNEWTNQLQLTEHHFIW